MKTIILAAGYATRLYPLTENFPKPLLPVGGKPILNWLIEDLKSVTDEFIVVTNHKFADAFRGWAESYTTSSSRACIANPEGETFEASAADNGDVTITVIDDGTCDNATRLGAVKDIALAAEGIDDDVFVMAGDNVLDFSLVPFVQYAQKAATSCVMCHEENRLAALQKTAVITTDESGLITSYEEKPAEPKGHLAVPPFYYYRHEDLIRIEEALKDGCGYDAPGSFAAWLSRKTPMHAWKMTGRRHDIGDMASYEAVRDSFKGIQTEK